MGISVSGIHYSLVSIDIGNLWEVIADAIAGKNANWIGVSEYTKALTDAVAKQNNDGILYVSVGIADFLTPWIRRLCSENMINAGGVKIRQIVVKHIHLDLAQQLESIGMLESNFVEKLKLNIGTLQSDPSLKCYNIETVVRPWKTMPFFHGYLLGGDFLIGHWQVGHGGHWHVRTLLFKSDDKKLPNVHAFVKKQFEEV
jgi:hypothetical protein